LRTIGTWFISAAAPPAAQAWCSSKRARSRPKDASLRPTWAYGTIDQLARIARFIERMGSVPAIQLAHAGRKASCVPPVQGGARITDPAQGGWPVLAPSPIPFVDGDPAPVALDEAGIARIREAFVAAAKRAIEAGFRVIDMHNAHGYLLHEFLSPLSNQRTDRYGGSFENRIRFSCEVASALRRVMPDSMPLFTRISCTDWAEGGWDLDQSIALSRCLKQIGVDLMDCSSGALVRGAKIPIAPNYQVPFAAAIREQAGMATGAVGMITEPEQANEIITSGKADLAFLAKEMLRDPYWAVRAEAALGAEPHWPLQYGYAIKLMQPKPKP